MELKSSALSSDIGVEIGGLDLGNEQFHHVIDELRALLDRHHLLAFRSQHLTAQEQVRFLSAFGPVVDEVQDGSYVSYVSNRRPDGVVTADGRLLWHSDNTWSPYPTHSIALFAEEVVGDLVPTRFASTIRAYNTLPAPLRQRIAGLKTINLTSLIPPDEDVDGDGTPSKALGLNGRRVYQELPADNYYYPRSLLPIVSPHPRTGAPMLHVNEWFSMRIETLNPAVSEDLYQEIFATLYDERYVYEHHWRQGDLVLWDNLALQHSRRAFEDISALGVRTLRRACTQPNFTEYLNAAPRVRDLGNAARAAGKAAATMMR